MIGYQPAAAKTPESYRVEFSVADLILSRSDSEPVHGMVLAQADLMRNSMTLRRLEIAAVAKDAGDHALRISGSMEDFAHPRWRAKAEGELDLKLVRAATGDPDTPEGVARMDLVAAGKGTEFSADGTVHIDGFTYTDAEVKAIATGVDARLHADLQQLQLTSFVARLPHGGEIDGEFVLDRWLGADAGEGPASNPEPRRGTGHANRPRPPEPATAKVTARLKNVAVDAILDALRHPRIQRVGLGCTGERAPSPSPWQPEDARTLVVDANFKVDPTGQPEPGEAAAGGELDATYTHRDGVVHLRQLDLHLPGSSVAADGTLGVHPLAGPTSLAIDFHSSNLGEFDTVLRKLGLTRHGKNGTEALPILLGGQADFRGSWTGSLIDPRITGSATATQLAVEVPSPAGAAKVPGPPQSVRFDSVQATGSYSAARIEISRAQLRRGQSEISVDGSLAADETSLAPVFDSNSMLRLHLGASKVAVGELLPLLGSSLPVLGSLSAQIEAEGPVGAPGGSGWVELDGGSVYGEPVARIRAQGTVANQTVKLTSVTVSEDAGKISATGSYDLKSKRFQVDARGAGMDAARIEWLRRQGLVVAGRLGFWRRDWARWTIHRWRAMRIWLA